MVAKSNILDSFQLSQVYSQNLKEIASYTYIENVREKENSFLLVCASNDFKSCVSFDVKKNYLEDQVEDIEKVVVMADDFKLTHHGNEW